MALQLDASADCAVNANLLARAAAMLATVEPRAGFDRELFLANFVGMFEQGSEEEALAKNFTTSVSVIFQEAKRLPTTVLPAGQERPCSGGSCCSCSIRMRHGWNPLARG
jgi:hypothetical protein